MWGKERGREGGREWWEKGREGVTVSEWAQMESAEGIEHYASCMLDNGQIGGCLTQCIFHSLELQLFFTITALMQSWHWIQFLNILKQSDAQNLLPSYSQVDREYEDIVGFPHLSKDLSVHAYWKCDPSAKSRGGKLYTPILRKSSPLHSPCRF